MSGSNPYRPSDWSQRNVTPGFEPSYNDKYLPRELQGKRFIYGFTAEGTPDVMTEPIYFPWDQHKYTWTSEPIGESGIEKELLEQAVDQECKTDKEWQQNVKNVMRILTESRVGANDRPVKPQDYEPTAHFRADGAPSASFPEPPADGWVEDQPTTEMIKANTKRWERLKRQRLANFLNWRVFVPLVDGTYDSGLAGMDHYIERPNPNMSHTTAFFDRSWILPVDDFESESFKVGIVEGKRARKLSDAWLYYSHRDMRKDNWQKQLLYKKRRAESESAPSKSARSSAEEPGDTEAGRDPSSASHGSNLVADSASELSDSHLPHVKTVPVAKTMPTNRPARPDPREVAFVDLTEDTQQEGAPDPTPAASWFQAPPEALGLEDPPLPPAEPPPNPYMHFYDDLMERFTHIDARALKGMKFVVGEQPYY